MSIVGRVKRWAKRRALNAQHAAAEVAELAHRAHWSPRQAVDYLRATARAAIVALGASPAKADDYVHRAELELGHLMLLAAIDELGDATKRFKLPSVPK